jgi:hypothetical protein
MTGVRRWIEADGIGLAVHFDAERTEEEVAVFEDLARWIAANPERIRAVIHDPHPTKLTEAEAAESGDRQLKRIESLRRRAGMDQ